MSDCELQTQQNANCATWRQPGSVSLLYLRKAKSSDYMFIRYFKFLAQSCHQAKIHTKYILAVLSPSMPFNAWLWQIESPNKRASTDQWHNLVCQRSTQRLDISDEKWTVGNQDMQNPTKLLLPDIYALWKIPDPYQVAPFCPKLIDVLIKGTHPNSIFGKKS